MFFYSSEVRGVHGSGEVDAPVVQSHSAMPGLGISQSTRQAADRDIFASLVSPDAIRLAFVCMQAEEQLVGRSQNTPRQSRSLLHPPLLPPQTLKESRRHSIALAPLVQNPRSFDDTSSYCGQPYTFSPRSAFRPTASSSNWICASTYMSISGSTTSETTIFTALSSMSSSTPPTITSESSLSREKSFTSITTTTSSSTPSTPSITPSSTETFISSSSTLVLSLPTSMSLPIFGTTILPTSSRLTNPISSSAGSSDTIPNSSVHSPSASSSITSIILMSSASSVPSTSSSTPSSDISTLSSTRPSLTSEPSITSSFSPFTSTEISFSTKTITTPIVLTSTTHRNGALSTSTLLEPGVLSTDNPEGPNAFARNTGAIVGIAVASTCFIILAVILLFFLCKRRKGRRYWSGNIRSPAGLQFNPWQPPLAGDDDALYYTQNRRHSSGSFQRLGSVTHTSEMAHTGTELVGAVHNTHELNSSESSFSHTQSRSLTHQTLSLSGRAEPESVTPFPTNTYFMPPPSAWSEPLHGPLHADAGSSLPSLYAGTSSNGHLHASTSSSHGHVCTPPSSHGHMNEDGDMYANALSYGHATTISPSEHGLLSTNSSAARGTSSLKDLVGRFRSGGHTLPTIQVDRVTSPSQSLPSWQSYPPPLSPSKAVSTMSLNRHNKPTLGPIEPHYLWPAATLPPLPSPTNTESSRILENLLTPHIGTRIASSQHSSSASLRDHVDYSRPINGAIRNVSHSTRTYSTDTDTVVDATNT